MTFSGRMIVLRIASDLLFYQGAKEREPGHITPAMFGRAPIKLHDGTCVVVLIQGPVPVKKEQGLATGLR